MEMASPACTGHILPAQAAMHDPIYEAIRILTADAASLRESHTPSNNRGDWTSEPEAKVEYEHMLRVVVALVKLRAPVANERAKDAFESMWSEINGPASWQANPWVWVLEFRRVR